MIFIVNEKWMDSKNGKKETEDDGQLGIQADKTNGDY